MSDPLLEAITSLRAALHEFTREASIPFADPAERLKPLAAVVESIGCDRPVKPRELPQEYRAQWRAFVAGRRQDLEWRAVRFLCWEPEVGADPRFHDYLDKAKVELTARCLVGLVASAHQRWSSELAEGPVGASLRKRLRTYSGPNQRVFRWRSEVPIVAGANGAMLLGEQIAKMTRPIGEVTAEWGFIEDSDFMRQAVGAATQTCDKQLRAGSPIIAFLLNQLIGWRCWDKNNFKDQLGSWILSEHTARLEELREGLKRIALDRLGDPRLPANAASWLGVRREAQDEFLRWLSHEDIEFFFEHVLPDGSDPHGRKDFWLKYVGRVRRSRPLLCPSDKYRLRNLERRSPTKVGHYGEIDGGTSAFMLDFGEILVVEFSIAGNAGYIYDRASAARVIPDFWKPTVFWPSDLKESHASIGRIIHRRSMWREKTKTILALNGIRPGS